MVESAPSNDAGEQKRRSTRIVQAIPVNVAGVDALGQPFKERTTTVMVNCHGCKYQSKHYVPKNSTITLEIPRTEPALPPRTVKGRVVWVQRPKAVRELFQIGLEFETAGNVWGIAFPPDDWFPCAEYQTAEVSGAIPIAPETTEMAARIPGPSTADTGAPPETSPDSKIHVVPAPAQTADPHLANALQMAKLVSDAKEALDKTLRRDAHAVINEEMTVVRQQLDVQLHEAVEHAIKVSMERVSESAGKKFIQQASERSAAIVEEARKASHVNAENLDTKVREAVQRAVSHAAQEAAKQAAEQTTAHNLKQTVEEAVERVVRQREAATPSLGILASPQAAQEHLDQWKKSLEENAHDVRNRTIAEAEADAAAARQRWNDEFAAAVNNASQKLEEKIGEVSEAAVTRAEQEIAAKQANIRSGLDEAAAGAQSVFQSLGSTLEQERARTEEMRARLEESAKATLEIAAEQANIRSGLDEAVAGAQSIFQSLGSTLEQERARTEETRARLEESAQATLEIAAKQANIRSGLDEAVAGAQSIFQSLGSTLEQERARTEETRAQLEESAKATLDESRRRLDEMISAQEAEAARKADELISARAQHIEPVLQDSARKAIENFSGELDQRLVPKLEAAEQAASKLSHAGEEAAQAQRSLREQVHIAAEQAEQIQAALREQARRASQQAEEAQTSLREQVQQASEQVEQIQTELHEQVQNASQQVVWQSIERMREESAKLPAELEESFRAVVSKAEEEFEQKSTEAQHETFEALSKASDWYQKKAQTTMQSALEKAVEHSATALRGRAAEISAW